MIKMTVPARIEELDRVFDFINTGLEVCECPLRTRMHIMIVAEEIFKNIVNANSIGKNEVTIRCMLQEKLKAIEISFTNKGLPYNPLNNKVSDINLLTEDEEADVLGMFVLKKGMDMASYEYIEQKNIVKLLKLFSL